MCRPYGGKKPLLGQSVQQFQHFFRRSGDHRAPVPDDHRPLHQRGLPQQQVHHRGAGDVVVGVQAEFLEFPVLAHQFRGFVGQPVEEPFQVRPAQRTFEIFDDVELDAALAQNVERPTRLASTGVVIDGQFGHGQAPPSFDSMQNFSRSAAERLGRRQGSLDVNFSLSFLT